MSTDSRGDVDYYSYGVYIYNPEKKLYLQRATIRQDHRQALCVALREYASNSAHYSTYLIRSEEMKYLEASVRDLKTILSHPDTELMYKFCKYKSDNRHFDVIKGLET